MPSQFPVLDNKPIDQWRVTELREELKRRKLSPKGLKEELVKRLNEAIKEEELEKGEDLDDDDSEHNQDLQNSSNEDEDDAKEDNSKSISDEDTTADKVNAPINNSNDMLGSGNYKVDEIKNVVLARKDEQNAATTKEVETSSSNNQSATPQSGMQVDDAESDQKYEDSKFSIEGSAVNQLEPGDQEVKQSSSHNYPTVGEHSCMIGNVQQTGDSQLIDEQEAGKKIEFGRVIGKDITINDGTGLKHIFVKEEVVLEHPQLGNADKINVLEPEVVKQEVEKSSSHDNPIVGEESCMVDNDQEPVDFHSNDEPEAGKKLVVDEREIDEDAMFDKQEVMNIVAMNDKDGYQNHNSVNKEVVVEHASLEHADNVNALELKVVNQGIDQPLCHSNPTAGGYSCIVGNRQEAGDSRLIDDEEAGKKLVADGQEIDKNLLSDKQEATNSIVTNDAHVCRPYGLDMKVAMEHATLKNADTLNALELVVKQHIEVDKNFLSGQQESTNSIATNAEVVGQIHVSVEEEVVVEHTLLEDADMLNTSNVAPPIKEDFADGSSEKLNLDRSSGDEFMEEDILESKHMEPDIQFHESTDISKISKANVMVVEQAAGLETSKFSPETKEMENGKPSAAVEKRKLEDTEAVGNNGAPKRQRRWNPDTIKVPEQQTTHLIDSMTPKNTEQLTVHRAFNRSNSILSEDSPKERIVPAPKRSATTSLRIDNFVRPFTLKAVQELLAKTGTLCDFWMDHIKTHCYVTYSSAEEATETRNAVYNLRWPPNGDRLLVAEFVDPREVKVRVEAPPQSPAPISPIPLTPKVTPYPQSQAPLPPSRQQTLRSQPHHSVPPLVQPPPPPPLLNPPVAREQLPPPPSKKAEPSVAAAPLLNPPPIAKEQLPPPPLKKAETPVVTLDDLFKKTKATPRIYYLPLSQEQVAAKLAAQARNPQAH
ncbi:hypothetical protein HPP92_018493 [Vanilla planifolia]|uniref:SAP domain-containing protein n=1 Tax=Vanilla planifolia TaxID=51239 RepID=A0A835UP09_VANPL|nr:hypothetical protein HPP92_019110 [Vanilla planifolia]KAG0469165.1 hypothetical protein HPP92_018493 [Vanilla planifolia]